MTETNDNVEQSGLPDSWPDEFDVIMGNPPSNLGVQIPPHPKN